MKKILAIILATLMLSSFAACGNTTEDGAKNNSDSQDSVDMSNYPSDMNEWTSQNFVDYFTEAGVFTEGTGRETWIQGHEDYWANTPVNECAGYWDDEGMILIMIFTFDESNPDTSEAAVTEFKDYIKENHTLTEEYGSYVIDHMIGDVAFSYSLTVDEEVYNAMDEAYQQLVDALGVTPDF